MVSPSLSELDTKTIKFYQLRSHVFLFSSKSLTSKLFIQGGLVTPQGIQCKHRQTIYKGTFNKGDRYIRFDRDELGGATGAAENSARWVGCCEVIVGVSSSLQSHDRENYRIE